MESITVEELKANIRELKNGRSPGRGNISTELIKYDGDTLLLQITHLFNLCLTQ